MTPFVTNLLVGGILALIGWAIAFGIYVIRQDRAREREIAALRLEVVSMRSEFVAKSAWDEYTRRFDEWKDKVMEKLGHLSEVLAGIKAGG